MVGGWLNDEYGWRHALLLFGLIGLPVCLAGACHPCVSRRAASSIRCTCSERPDAARDTAIHCRPAVGDSHPDRGDRRDLSGMGIMWWLRFLVRSYQLTTGAAGAILGPIKRLRGAGITLVTAWLCWMNGRRDARRDTWLVGVTTLVATFPASGCSSPIRSTSRARSLWIFFRSTTSISPTFGMLQNLVPAPMRGLIIRRAAVVANFANLFIAPQLNRIASDVVGARIASPAEIAAVGALWYCVYRYLGAMALLRAANGATDFASRGQRRE